MSRAQINASDFQDFVQSKLFGFKSAKAMAAAWNCGENIILFGAGGYGKSDAAIMLNQFLHTKGLVESPNPYVLAFGQGMTEERLLGGLDVKRFQEQGEINYLLANAFVSHEVVIFEELWDAFPAVLLILKDILQSRCVRMGNQVMPIKTKMVIACTNRSAEEVVSDNSTEALMQRFVFSSEEVWSSWEKSDFLGAFCCATGREVDETMHLVAEAAALSSKGESKVSPRTAGKALKSAYINGIESLSYMRGFSAIKEVLAKADSKTADAIQLCQLEASVSKATQLAADSKVITSAIKALVIAKQINTILLSVEGTAKRDSNITAFKSAVEQIQLVREAAFVHAQSLIKSVKVGSIFAKAYIAHGAANFDWTLIRE